MKKIKYTIVIALSSMLVISCGGKKEGSANEASSGATDAKAKKMAESFCKLAKEIGLDENLKFTDDYMRKNADKMEDRFYENSDKFILLLKDIDNHLKTLNQVQSQKFAKELAKAIIDTDCSNILFKEIPYSDLGKVITEIEKDITRTKYRRDNPEESYDPYYDPYGDSASSNEYPAEAMPEYP